MKLLLVEFWHSHIYAEALLPRFEQLGVEVVPFRECAYFDCDSVTARPNIWLRVQEKFRWGPSVNRLNDDLVARARDTGADAAFIIRGGLIFPETIRRLKDLGVWVVGWNNDDPFSPMSPRYLWRHLLSALSMYDRYFAYRHANVPRYLERGCPRVEVLRSYYIKELNYHMADTSGSPYQCDVSFSGHWEADGREQYIGALLDAPDFRFRLFGTFWDRASDYARIQNRLGVIRPVYKHDYNLVLNSTKIALVFLSKLNNDTYTRRCFEIPAAGTFMLSEYTDDLNAMFKEGVEAEYFRSKRELLDKARYYLGHDEARKRIAQAGHERVLKDGHEAIDRVKEIVRIIQKDLGEKRASENA